MNAQFMTLRRSVYCCLLALFLTACAKDDISPVDVEKQAFSDLRDQIREVVESPEREAEAIRLVTKLEEDLAALRVRIAERKKTFRELNANYDTPRAEIEEYLEQVSTEIREHKQSVSEVHRELMSSMEPDEISSIAKAHTSAMKSAITTIQSI